MNAEAAEEARTYFHEQTALTRLQVHELKDGLKLRHWSKRVRHVSDVLKLGFELAVAFIVLVIAAGVAVIIWQATHAGGLVIEPFSVPAPVAEKGLTGQVIANKLLDHLTIMQNTTDSTRAPSSFSNDWTNDIKVQIADTGVSLGEAVRFLNNWLGHQMHLSGELYETASGYALSVRTDNEPSQTFEGKPGDLDSLVTRAAEAVFARAQPYRYAAYLRQESRFPEADATLRGLAEKGPRNEVAWADVGLAFDAVVRGDDAAARSLIAEGATANPNLPNLYAALEYLDCEEGHQEACLRDNRKEAAMLKGGGAREWDPSVVQPSLVGIASSEAFLVGDYRTALADNVFTRGSGGEVFVTSFSGTVSALAHDGAAARGYYAQLQKLGPDPDSLFAPELAMLISVEAGDWKAVAAQVYAASSIVKKLAATNKWINPRLELQNVIMPYLGYARAMQGNFRAADGIFRSLPMDCDHCLLLRAKAEALRRHWNEAARWLSVVAARSPEIPFADTEWGAMLLHKGDYGAAIAKFQEANRKGPRFADPLEMWGEALMLKNRSDLALAKFEEANNYAPNWGRLHLKWGEALMYVGRKNDAKREFEIASHLDLNDTDAAALAAWKGGA